MSLPELDPAASRIVDAARAKLKEHFRGRMAVAASELVAERKKQEVYPYAGDSKSNVETAKRQMFDVVALNVHNYSPDFRDSDVRGKRLQLRLLAQALEDHPAAVRKIWVKLWSEVINEAKARLAFFREGLEYEASDESALAYSRRLHAEHLPIEVLSSVQAPVTELSVVRRVSAKQGAKRSLRRR